MCAKGGQQDSQEPELKECAQGGQQGEKNQTGKSPGMGKQPMQEPVVTGEDPEREKRETVQAQKKNIRQPRPRTGHASGCFL